MGGLEGWAPKGGGPRGGNPSLRIEGQEVRSKEVEAPKVEAGAQHFARFLSFSCSNFDSFSPLLGAFSWNVQGI